jgi:hypothetical protein
MRQSILAGSTRRHAIDKSPALDTQNIAKPTPGDRSVRAERNFAAKIMQTRND